LGTVFYTVIFVLLPIVGVTEQAQWHKTFQLPGKPEVHIRALDAKIQIRSGENNEVSVRIFSGSDGKGLVNVDDKSLANVLNLDIDGPPAQPTKPSDNSTMRIELILPQDASVAVSCRNGDIAIDGVNGLIGVSTGVGNINIRAARASVRADSRQGDIQVEASFSIVHVTGRDGQIKVRAEAGSKILPSDPWVLASDLGNIDLMLPADFDADLEARSLDGSVSVEIPITTVEPPNPKRAKGRLGHGGGALAILTRKGKVHIGLAEKLTFENSEGGVRP
jgi:hypothetical protein